MSRLTLAAPLVLLAAACNAQGPADQDGGTQIAIRGAGGNFSAGVGKDGQVAIDMPGLKGSIALPKFNLDADNFDINGVGLPAGSKVDTINVNGDGGRDEKVRIAFTSPLGTAGVRDWFQGKLAAQGFTLTARGDDLSGTTDEGKPFRLTTKPAGDGRSQSVIAIGE